MEPEEFAVDVRRAEKRALPTIKEKRLGPAAAQLLLAQLAQLLGGVFLVFAALSLSLLDALFSMARSFSAIFPGSQIFALFHLISTA